MNIGYIYLIIFAIVSALKPIFFRTYKKYQFANIFASNISFFITALIIVSIKTNDHKLIQEKLKNTFRKNYKDLIEKINSKTKLISITHMSNITGSITNFEEIKNKANKLKLDYYFYICYNVVKITWEI